MRNQLSPSTEVCPAFPGVIPADDGTVLVGTLADNADPLAAELYAVLDMPFATLLGRLAAIKS